MEEDIKVKIFNKVKKAIYFNKISLPITTYDETAPTGDHNYKGSTNIEEIDFEAFIPPKYTKGKKAEQWFKEQFEKQNIDSSIRVEVLKILIEVGLELDIKSIHSRICIHDIIRSLL